LRSCSTAAASTHEHEAVPEPRWGRPVGDERVRDAHALLRELIGQDFDIDDDGVPRLHRGTRAERIVSVVDPEMRHGRKSQSQRFDGFKPSAAATNTREPLICAVDVAPASEHDGARVGAKAGWTSATSRSISTPATSAAQPDTSPRSAPTVPCGLR